MNQALDSNFFDFVNHPTVKCSAITKPNTRQTAPQIPEKQETETYFPLSIQEPYYPTFALEPCVVFLTVFVPLFLSVIINANAIIYIFVSLMGIFMRAQ